MPEKTCESCGLKRSSYGLPQAVELWAAGRGGETLVRWLCGGGGEGGGEPAHTVEYVRELRPEAAELRALGR